MASNVFCRAVQNDIRAKRQWPLENRCGKRIVNDREGTDVPGATGDSFEVRKNFTVSISQKLSESQISCFVKIIKFKKSSIDIAQKLKAIEAVESCYSVTGEESLFLRVRARTTKDLQETLELINRVDGVERTLSSLIIEEHFNKGQVIL